MKRFDDANDVTDIFTRLPPQRPLIPDKIAENSGLQYILYRCITIITVDAGSIECRKFFFSEFRSILRRFEI